jgi:hypothetical protein
MASLAVEAEGVRDDERRPEFLYRQLKMLEGC